jgi:hypothetical protein
MENTTNDLFFAKLTARKYDNINIEEGSELGGGACATVYKSQMIIDGTRQTGCFTTETAESCIFAGGRQTVPLSVKCIR